MNTTGKDCDKFLLGVAICFAVAFLSVTVEKLVPWFICGFLALAAIGLGTSITDFRKAGLAPMFYGITIDTLVTLTAPAVIWCMGLM